MLNWWKYIHYLYTFKKLMNLKIKAINSFVFLAVIFNISVFCCINSIKMHWTNDEILWQGAFWSETQNEEQNLYTGLKKEDWLKPFNIYHADGTFRTRQVSYALEMLSFKFWQLFEKVFLRNFTLIFLHILNTILAGILIFYLSKCRKTAILSALLLLNSGAALATLLYPFRNAKLLVMTFFLLSWIVIAKNNKKISQYSLTRIFLFFTLLILALFTDEISIFIFPIIFVFISLKEGIKGWINPKMISGLAASFIIFLFLAWGAKNISVNIIDSSAPTGEQAHYIQSLGKYLTNPIIFKDISNAFFNYFLRRNFGYWDSTIPGILSAIAFGLIFLSIFLFRTKSGEAKISFIIGAFLLIKAFLFPHNAGYHRVFMPEGTIFPSLFFFSYYYIYCEAVLFALILGILLKGVIADNRRYGIILLLISMISISNALHLKQGPQDALKFMRFDAQNKEQPQKMVAKVLAIKKILKDKKFLPVYLSFPSGNSNTLLAKRNDPFKNLYARMIPFKYLKSIEKGLAVISYKNIEKMKPKESSDELSDISFFYDVISEKKYNMQSLIKSNGSQGMSPAMATKESIKTKSTLIKSKKIDHIIFFIKGRSAYLLQHGTKRIEGQQNYGQAYQMFRINDFPQAKTKNPSILNISFIPIAGNNKATLLGPFIIEK